MRIGLCYTCTYIHRATRDLALSSSLTSHARRSRTKGERTWTPLQSLQPRARCSALAPAHHPALCSARRGAQPWRIFHLSSFGSTAATVSLPLWPLCPIVAASAGLASLSVSDHTSSHSSMQSDCPRRGMCSAYDRQQRPHAACPGDWAAPSLRIPPAVSSERD